MAALSNVNLKKCAVQVSVRSVEAEHIHCRTEGGAGALTCS